MFTGIIQNLGTVRKKQKKAGQIHFLFSFKRAEKNIKVGESIAVNGVCLTATKISAKSFEADVVEETLKATTLGQLKIGDQVNLERSLKYGDSMGGHFVTGHVDGIGKIVHIKKSGKNQIFGIQTSKEIISQLARKGSVACDGISLTIQSVDKAKAIFEVALIPHTLRETTFGKKRAGNFLNLEIDLISRYLKVLDEGLGANPRGSVQIKDLIKQGF